MQKSKGILWNLYMRLFMKKRFQTVEDMEYLSQKGIRPVLHNGQVSGWEVRRG